MLYEEIVLTSVRRPGGRKLRYRVVKTASRRWGAYLRSRGPAFSTSVPKRKVRVRGLSSTLNELQTTKVQQWIPKHGSAWFLSICCGHLANDSELLSLAYTRATCEAAPLMSLRESWFVLLAIALVILLAVVLSCNSMYPSCFRFVLT